MSLRDKIETDYKNALKLKDKNKISTYRLPCQVLKIWILIIDLVQIKKKLTRRHKKIVKKMIKQRSES